jgi:hypothetical protein
MIDDEFFSKYTKTHKKPIGIPGFKMNAPIVTNNYLGTIGIELEIEGRALPREGHLDVIRGKDTGAMWSAINDGSLRGEAREYIFTQPVTRDELPFMVKGLFEVFKAFGSKINNSNRCSTHVHINMKGRTINQLTSIIALWAVFEELLIKGFCGEERQTNHFALSMQDSDSLPHAWENFIRFGNREFARGMKYSALNILPLWSLGSFEFRCGPAASDPETPVTWATFLDEFCKFACDKYTNPAYIAHDLSERGGLEIFDDILKKLKLSNFRNKVVGDIIDDKEFNETCLKGFRTVQPIVLGYPWEEWLELINREFVPNPFEKVTRGIKTDPNLLRPRAPRLEPEPDVPGQVVNVQFNQLAAEDWQQFENLRAQARIDEARFLAENRARQLREGN